MIYNIVAGEELKKKLMGIIDNPIPFNEDMSKGTYNSEPFSEEFFNERSLIHGVSIDLYKEKLNQFLNLLQTVKQDDEVHLYFGEDETCIANRELVIEHLQKRVNHLYLHIVDEYSGKELDNYLLK